MPVSSGETAIVRKRKRTAGACQSCHERKVRCSLSHTGSPCINCALDHLVCELRVAKKRRAKTHESSIQIQNLASSPANANPTPHDDVQRERAPLLDSGATTAPASSCHHQSISGAILTSIANDDDNGEAEAPYHSLGEHFSHYGGQGGNGVLHANENASENHFAPIYGDPRGVSLVADICEPQRKDRSGHLLVPRIRQPNVDSETLNYLRLRGIFDLPTPEACEMLIRDYFNYVHPFFPVVEARSFIEQLETSLHNLSIHLLWSIFLAASNFADDATLEAVGFTSRKEMKRFMYTKAKALYDAEYERNKITLIQAVLLMGFWYADTEDRTGPWHWNGVAISLCQTIGLHRNPDTSSSSAKSGSMIDKKLWRQLWWSCFYREAWFSAGMGRPMRIRLADCNTTMPDAEAEDELESLPKKLREKYLPNDLRDIGKLWTQLLNVTVVLSNVLLQQQRAQQTLPTEDEVQAAENQIRSYSDEYKTNASRKRSNLATLYAYHFEIYVESVSLILYRPFLLPDLTGPTSDDWKLTVEQRTRSAAMATNQILSNIIRADMTSVCQSTICIALVPTLQIHLLDYASPKPSIQRMGHQNLELCMIVVEELKKTLFGGEILYRMFTRAQKQIRDRKLPVAPSSAAASGNELSSSTTSTTMDILSEMSPDEFLSQENGLDTLLAIWNPGAPIASYESWDNSE
ncbi:hypothetical protein BS50DRAFT_672268 [Corynespora cassiicola Philippines]|uniref:Zn(2)-C6 fungal-type domain-containing protein n=1 Tax=Corynespora cassiicola Philippines TaxID=1448308 RepID=A0A2T2P6N6_CORCC|nr:hypothetical protein BS50DRAFT_672268 [Corynespora cassiicola Philippines]